MNADPLNPNVRARICTHMNHDHQEALIELAKHYGNVKTATNVKMLDITSSAIKLKIDKNMIEIGFEHELVDSADAHRSIVKMLKSIPTVTKSDPED